MSWAAPLANRLAWVQSYSDSELFREIFECLSGDINRHLGPGFAGANPAFVRTRYAQFVGQMRLPPGDRRCEPRPSCNRPALGPTPRLRRDKREAWFVIAGDFSAKYSVPTKIVPAREVDH